MLFERIWPPFTDHDLTLWVASRPKENHSSFAQGNAVNCAIGNERMLFYSDQTWLFSDEDSPDEEVGKEMSNLPGKSLSSKKDDTGSTLKPDTEKPQSVANEVPPEEEDDTTSKSLLERIFSSFNEGYNHRQLELLKKKRSYQEKVWRDAPENAPDDSQQVRNVFCRAYF